MDISTFRWTLIIVGVAILAVIFLIGNPRGKKRRASRKKSGANRRSARAAVRREPTLDSDEPPPSRFEEPGTEEEPQGQLIIEPTLEPALEPVLEPGAEPTVEPEPAARPESPLPIGPAPDKIVAVYLLARDNQLISGLDLLDAGLKSGMDFGAGDVFHRTHEGSEQPIFSMANLTNPGTFDKSAWNTMETRGVTLIMALPGPMGALDAWDAMLATGRRLSELLHADLLDKDQAIFTRQREGEVRQDLRDYERSLLPEG
jgi:cell division protein ZipA